jgi:ATPase family associated with various cellular activities (AAA)
MTAGFPYTTSLEHILAELERFDLLLRIQAWRAGQRREDVGRAIGAPAWADTPLRPELLADVQPRLDELSATIATRTAASLAAGVPLRLIALARLLGLGSFDVNVVLACLALELDRGYEQLYAGLHDDPAAVRPTAGLVVDLFGRELEDRVAARARLAPGAPLLDHAIVEAGDQPAGSWLATPLRLDPRVTRFLFDQDEVDERLRCCARVVIPEVGLASLVLPVPLRDRLAGLMRSAASGADDLVIYLQGPHGAGRRAMAAAGCAALGIDLLVADGARLAATGLEQFELMVRLADREARLQGALLLWEDFDTLLAGDQRTKLAHLLSVLDNHPGPIFLAGGTAWEPTDALPAKTFVRLELPQPGAADRLRLWRDALGDDATAALDLDAVANTFRLTGGRIRDAVATARGLATARDPAGPAVTQADLTAGCRLQSNRKLAELAQLVSPHYGWDDIVLPADQLAQLREIADQVRYRTVVHEDWGFDAKLSLGKGLNVLFAGPPGTGKTMAPDVLAGELGLDLYKIDLSGVVSKYVGETEKNLARIFDEARTSNAILFFDEADALFGKRTQVRDAHDRYANVEISYLLQKMDEYEGVVVLATNLRKNMDEAFVRRLHFAVDFPLPGLDDRRRIWERIWPDATPRDPELDLDLLAERVEVAGGSIRNIALAGAFLAAADGGVVGLAHLLRATLREYQKMGKILTAADLEAP